MFGRKGKLEDRLARGDLRQAQAAVVKVRKLGTGDDRPGLYRAHVRIEVAGEEPFEATVQFNATNTGIVPHEGGTIPVAYDPEDRDNVIWDENAARGAAAAAHAYDRERRERLAAERREAGLPPVEASGPDPDLEARLVELNARKERGELNDWEFRQARAEIFKNAGF